MAQPIIAENNNLYTDFCVQLASKFLEAEISKGSNFVASPLSLHAMLSLAALGSKGNTLKQLLFFLGSTSVDDLSSLASQIVSLASSDQEDLDDGDLILSFLNGAFIDKRFDLKPGFKAIVESNLKADIRNVDFIFQPEEAVDKVNSWAEKSTKGLIKNLVPYDAVDDKTVLILANALYFKGTWDRKFDVSMTRARDFHLLNGNIVRAPFMTTDYFVTEHSYRCFDDHMVLRIPYKSNRDSQIFSMYFFLPNEKDGLLSLIRKVESNPKMLNQNFQLVENELTEFWIPKFKFSFEFKASPTMMNMGLNLLFNPPDLTEMVNCEATSKRLFVSEIFHKACIEVNEEGTEAAACTAMICKAQCYRKYPSFIADRPFLFMIREEVHNAVFFIGAVLNPLLSS